MNKILQTIIILVVLWMPINLVIVKAGCCEEGYYNLYPGGVNPPTDPSMISNCNSLESKINVKAVAKTACNICTASTKISFDYCSSGTKSISTAEGSLVLYAPNKAFKFNFKTATQSKEGSRKNYSKIPIEFNNIILSVGDWYEFSLGGDAWKDGTGWRKLPENFNNEDVNRYREDAKNKGYTIISEQYWSDNKTSSNYDSYDFNDIYVIIALKPLIEIPSCDEANLSLNVNPTNIFLSENTIFKINANQSLYKAVGNKFSVEGQDAINFKIVNANNNSLNCIPSIGNNTCKVVNRDRYNASSFASSVNWTHNYQVCKGSACRSCSKSTNFTVYPYPGFMITDKGGTAYIAKEIKQARYPFDKSIFLTKYLLLKNDNTSSSTFKYVNSKSISSAYNYNDINNRGDFYTQLKNSLLNNFELNYVKIENNQTINNQFLSTLKNNNTKNPTDLIHIKGNAIIQGENITCQKPTIFLIDNNIEINDSIIIPANTDTACMFIIQHELNINLQSDNDMLDGFFIANSVKTKIPGNLSIRGSIVLQGSNQVNNYLKNINAKVVDASRINYTIPSELINYDGARYINIFGKYLREPINLTIREVGYITN